MIEKKVDSQKVWNKVNNLNSQLITIFGIKINKLPVTPISLTNGKMIFEINCAIKLNLLLQERMFPEIDTGAIS